MKLRLLLALAVTALGSAALVSGAAAGQGHGHARGQLYSFSGVLLATPGANAASVSLQIETGNRPALRALIGASQNQVFTVGSGTQVLIWSHGVPRVGSTADLQQGDYVTVKVRAPRGSSLQTIQQQAAARIAEHAAPRARLPLWLFIGSVAGPQSGGKIALHVESGNWKALHAMLGQPLDQSFTYDDGTIFVRWQGGVPTVIDAAQLQAGDRITLRIRAPRAATLAEVAATPANRVADREPPPAPQE